jgi:GTPase SAR1 family protein
MQPGDSRRAFGQTGNDGDTVMDGYAFQKSSILQINQDVRWLFQAARSIPGLADLSFGDWEKTCTMLPEQLNEPIIRVGVVGPIKSGKSTFLNALLKGDFLKRGAGVVTSIVTRVRAGERLKATLYYKSWSEVNADMEQALVLFPSLHWRSAEDRFDIRRKQERAELQQALDALSADLRISEDARNHNMVLLSCYLRGYEAVRPFLTDQQAIQHYEAERFLEHWKFTGNESLAVYLRDIQLDIHSGAVGSNIEVADCQGSDSSNPLHLAMIQDYLRSAHLLIYVISSRTGLRRADIKFLTMIKKMGILDNILFVVNCDFNEHPSLDDLKTLVARVSDDLALIRPRPEVYAFSALFNLFGALNGNLTERDRRRQDHWKTEAELVSFSDQETRRFNTVLNQILERQQYTLLLQNPIERLGSISAGMSHWIGVNRDILSRDAASARKVAGRIRDHQRRFGQILTAFQSALSGVGPAIKQEVGGDVNRFLAPGSGEIVATINTFISGFRLGPESYGERLRHSGFLQTLYQVFQVFKQALDSFITEQINPEIIRFIAAEEIKIRDALESIAAPYQGVIADAYTEFCSLMSKLGISIDCAEPESIAMPNIDSLLRQAGLSIPPLVTTIGYTARIRTQAVLRRGVYRTVSGFKKIMKKPVKHGEDDARAIQEAMRVIKRETRQSLEFHLKDYQENLKFRYLFRLAETVAQRFEQAVIQQLQAYSADFGMLAQRLGTQQGDGESAAVLLADMHARCQEIGEALGRLKANLSNAAVPGDRAGRASTA